MQNNSTVNINNYELYTRLFVLTSAITFATCLGAIRRCVLVFGWVVVSCYIYWSRIQTNVDRQWSINGKWRTHRKYYTLMCATQIHANKSDKWNFAVVLNRCECVAAVWNWNGLYSIVCFATVCCMNVYLRISWISQSHIFLFNYVFFLIYLFFMCACVCSPQKEFQCEIKCIRVEHIYENGKHIHYTLTCVATMSTTI